MDRIEMLERLISLKNNAQERSRLESLDNPLRRYEIQAYILHKGIEQLVIEIQNTMQADSQVPRTIHTYKLSISSPAC